MCAWSLRMLFDVGSAPRSRAYHRLLDRTSWTAMMGCGLTWARLGGAGLRALVFFAGILFATSPR
jgi:hypothetical protein